MINYGKTLRINNERNCKKDDEILLIKRHSKSKTGACQWELPGGKVEKCEFFDEALIREFKEETNLNVELGDFMMLYNKILSIDELYK